MAFDGKTIGLALSGGGFRATLFGLGSLWRLSDADLLGRYPARSRQFFRPLCSRLTRAIGATVSLRARTALPVPVATSWPLPEWAL